MASQLSGSSLIRLVEGIRLHRELPDTKLILSGGGAFGPMPEAVAMSQVAQTLGVMPQEIIIEEDSPDTEVCIQYTPVCPFTPVNSGSI